MRGVQEIVAHRGASAAYEEHTFAAYDAALRMGADALELDIRLREDDGELVVQHDPGTPARAPLTLDAVLTRYGARTRYLVELKDPLPAWEGRVVGALDRYGLRARAVLQSFDARALRRLHAADPSLPVAPLVVRPFALRRTLDRAAAYATGIGVWHGAVDARLVHMAHARGLAVRAWTANAPAEIDRLLALGVDGVITDVPDVARDRTRPWQTAAA